MAKESIPQELLDALDAADDALRKASEAGERAEQTEARLEEAHKQDREASNASNAAHLEAIAKAREVISRLREHYRTTAEASGPEGEPEIGGAPPASAPPAKEGDTGPAPASVMSPLERYMSPLAKRRSREKGKQ